MHQLKIDAPPIRVCLFYQTTALTAYIFAEAIHFVINEIAFIPIKNHQNFEVSLQIRIDEKLTK